MTAASDAHDHVALGTAYSILEADEFSRAGRATGDPQGPGVAAAVSYARQRAEEDVE